MREREEDKAREREREIERGEGEGDKEATNYPPSKMNWLVIDLLNFFRDCFFHIQNLFFLTI